MLRMPAGEEREKVAELLGELVGAECRRVAAERGRRDRVGPGRAPEPEVDAAGVQRFEHAELLGDHERGVVRQHHAARADPHRRGGCREVSDQHGRRRARDAGHVVVLGDPDPPVAEPLGQLRELDRVGECPCRRRTVADGSGSSTESTGRSAGQPSRATTRPQGAVIPPTVQ